MQEHLLGALFSEFLIQKFRKVFLNLSRDVIIGYQTFEVQKDVYTAI